MAEKWVFIGAGCRPKPPCYFWKARKALIRLAKSKIWSLIEKVTKTLSEWFRSLRRNELRYAQYNQRLNCCTLRYCSLIEKNPWIFSRSRSCENLTSCRFNGSKQIWACFDEVSCRELFKYKLLSTDFYVGARSEVGWGTSELTFGNNLSNIVSLTALPLIKRFIRSLRERYTVFLTWSGWKNIFISDSGRKTYKGFPSFALSDR